MLKSIISNVLLIVIFLFVGKVIGREMEVIFFDDFSSYQTDTDLLTKWAPFQGHWFVKDGVLHQDNGGFDHGIVVKDLYLRCDYRIETKVKLVSGGAGAGFYWNVADSLTGENGNMLRYDGNKPIMTGWMRGRGFVGTGGATGDLEPNDKWHDFRMDVKNSKGTMDLYWDGKKILEDGGIFHRSGYVGLECSLGYCIFDDVKISVAKGTDWRAVPRGEIKPEWIQSLAVLPDGNIAYPVRNLHRIQIVSPDGKLVREFGEMGQAPGQMYLPSGITVDKQGNIYVTEAGNNRVQVFASDGKSLKVITPSGENALKLPLGIAVEPTGQIWVSDAGNNRVVMLADDGSIPAKIGAPENVAGKEPGQFQTLGHLNIIDGKLYVADAGNRRIQIFDPRNTAAPTQVIPIKDTNPYSIAFDGKGTYLVAGGRGVMTYDKDWKLIKEYYGDATGEIWPLQATYCNDGNIIIADWWSHRLVITEPTLYPVQPEVTEITTDSAVVRWATDLPTPTKLLLLDTPQGSTWPSSVDYSKAKVCGDGLARIYHVVELKGLKPATRYTFSITSPRRIIPENGGSVDYRFATEAPKGTMAYTEVPLAILCYANVTFNAHKDAEGKVPPPAIRDDEWIKQVKKAHEGMRYFYWLNSYFRLDTKCYYYKVTRPVDFAYLGSSSEEVAKDLEALAKREKMKATDFGAVLVVGGNGTYAYPWPTPWWGGKLTYTTGCCFCGGGDMWIGTHEFHHLTEGWMSMIRTGGYTCADTPWIHPEPIGENYDFLANTLRRMGKDVYLNLAVGKLKTLVDKDGDLVPDNAPDLPYDEKRAETDPNNKDTYRNGLSELQNVTAEIFNSAKKGHKHPLLTKEYSRKFPFAVFDYEYERKKKTPVIDGKMTDGEWDKFASVPNGITANEPKTVWAKTYPPVPGANYTMDTYLNWDDEYLYFAAIAPYKFLMEVQLDCNGDGYFAGNDNPRMTFVVPRDETNVEAGKPMPVPGVMVWNNVEPVQATGGPNWTNEYFEQRDNIKWTWGKRDDGWYIIEAAIPKCPRVSLIPAENKEMAVRLWMQGFLPPTEKNPDPRFTFEMFDSCEYGYFKLVK